MREHEVTLYTSSVVSVVNASLPPSIPLKQRVVRTPPTSSMIGVFETVISFVVSKLRLLGPASAVLVVHRQSTAFKTTRLWQTPPKEHRNITYRLLDGSFGPGCANFEMYLLFAVLRAPFSSLKDEPPVSSASSSVEHVR